MKAHSVRRYFGSFRDKDKIIQYLRMELGTARSSSNLWPILSIDFTMHYKPGKMLTYVQFTHLTRPRTSLTVGYLLMAISTPSGVRRQRDTYGHATLE